MFVTVFGASGRTGVPLTRALLERGHRVRAVARRPERFPIADSAVEVVSGDVMDSRSVDAAVSDAEAVCSVVGHRRGSPPDLLDRTGAHIVDAMQRHSVRRLLILTGTGVHYHKDNPGLFDRLGRVGFLLVARRIYNDAVQYVGHIEGSGLDWTVVRVPLMISLERSGGYRVGYAGVDTRFAAARSHVAAFMADELTACEHLRDMPVVSDA